MYITQLKLSNFTTFEENSFIFDSGINIFIGENGTGKTHILKLLYAACQSANPKISFPDKLVRTMLPDDYKISRLITRKPGNHNSTVRVTAKKDKGEPEKTLSLSFNNKTKKSNGEVCGDESWERLFRDTSSIFIPAKEILSNSFNLAAAVDKSNVKFDDTYIDIINSAKIDISVGRNNADRDKKLKKIETIIGGIVKYDSKKDEFYLRKERSRQEFNLVAEGIRKMALLWQLVKNGTLEKGSILFWDEPEANINPGYLSTIAELLLELESSGVQIFLATHDYILAKYFEVRKKKENNVLFHSLCRKDDKIVYSQEHIFAELKNNLIIDSFNKLLDEVYDLEEDM